MENTVLCVTTHSPHPQSQYKLATQLSLTLLALYYWRRARRGGGGEIPQAAETNAAL